MKNHPYVVALMLVGCAADPLDEVASAVEPSDGCDLLNCPGNSNLLGVLAPYELHETGAEISPRGLRISGMWHNGQPVTSFQVAGTAPRATTGAGNTYTGGSLIGLTLRLEHEDGQQFDLRIDDYLSGKVPYYVGGAEIEGFYILYQPVGQLRWRELCPYASHVDGDVKGTYAVFWKGDRYDPETGKIFASNEGVGRWFNISCAGEATIKMLRTRTGGAVDPESPVEQRQATLNMFTASYCGPTGRLTTDGQPFTQLGQALTWNDLSGPNEIGTVWTYEAVWDEHGAVCLTQPRMVDRATIDCGRKIKSCGTNEMADMIANWASYGWLLSANPPPAP